MHIVIRGVIGVFVAVGVLAVSTPLCAETCTLQLKRLESLSTSRVSARQRDYAFRYVSPQHFFYQTGMMGLVRSAGAGKADFSDVVKKEPAKYNAKQPFRGVAKLGDQNFGFVLDSAPVEKSPAKKTEKATKKTAEKATKEKEATKAISGTRTMAMSPLTHYSRLRFDLNHNGDLTDDKVIKAEQKDSRLLSSNYASYSFPRVDVTIEAGGAKMDYAFTFSVYSYSQPGHQYASASLQAAAYREGEITLQGKKKRVVVVDFNSNGRFDDESAVNDRVMTSDGQLYATSGDMIYVDPKVEENISRYGYDATRNDEQHYVSKLVNIDDRFYDIKLSPGGDTLTLKPSSVAVGYVTNPNKGFRAVIYGKEGLIKICCGESGRVPVPAGEWKLLSYTIDRTGMKPEKPKAAEDSGSLLNVLTKAVVKGPPPSSRSSRPRDTFVSARGTKTCPAVSVGEGKTAVLGFGPPYEPVVKASGRSSGGQVSLSMSLVGSAGEVCTDLTVNGQRLKDPEFTISTPDGKKVESGLFKYG